MSPAIERLKAGNRALLAITLVFGLLLIACVLKMGAQHDQIADRDTAVLSLLAEIERDDSIFLLVFGTDWDRSRPVLSAAVEVTCYTSEVRQTDSTPYHTADGSTVRVGIIAVSRDMLAELGLKYGQRVALAGYGIFEIRDTMNSRWRRRVDIWLPDKRAAQLHGVKATTLLWVG